MNVLPKNTIGPGEHYFTNPSSENLIKLRHFAKVVHQRLNRIFRKNFKKHADRCAYFIRIWKFFFKIWSNLEWYFIYYSQTSEAFYPDLSQKNMLNSVFDFFN